MADPEIKRTAHRGDCIAKAHDRISDIVPSGLDYQQRSRLTDVLSKVWDDGYGHGRHDEATGEPADIAADEYVKERMHAKIRDEETVSQWLEREGES